MPLTPHSVFSHDFIAMYRMIKSREPFAFARFGDGEMAIMEGKGCESREGWVVGGGDTMLRRDLIESWEHSEPGFIKGICCPCCRGEKMFDRGRLSDRPDRLTWANLWLNANTPLFQELLLPAIKRNRSRNFLIGNRYFTNWHQYFCRHVSLPAPGEAEFSRFLEIPLELDTSNEPCFYAVSAGPAATVIVRKMWQTNKTNIYVDTGSVFDPLFLGLKTRPYQNTKNKAYGQFCIWS